MSNTDHRELDTGEKYSRKRQIEQRAICLLKVPRSAFEHYPKHPIPLRKEPERLGSRESELERDDDQETHVA